MKKVKIMLTAIALFAVVGGALAFKAHKFTGSTTIYTKGTGSSCTVQLATFTTVVGGGGTQISASTTNGGTCTAFYTGTTEFL